MKNARKLICVLTLIAVFVYIGTLLSDRGMLRRDVIRLHVVANSDSERDQAVKLQVKDAVVAFVEENLVNAKTAEEAGALLQDLMPKIRDVANRTLAKLGETGSAVVTFLKEEFPTRDYDSFRLPEGVYNSLRITIGEGRGQNWWCVVFPSLCAPRESFRDTAMDAGFSGPLAETLAGEQTYEVRFFFLEIMGKLENLFHR